MLTEAQLERYLRTRVHERDGLVIKIAPVIAGVPDDLVILPGGRMGLVELKTDVGVLSPIQVAFHKRLRLLGVKPVVLYGAEQVHNWAVNLGPIRLVR